MIPGFTKIPLQITDGHPDTMTIETVGRNNNGFDDCAGGPAGGGGVSPSAVSSATAAAGSIDANDTINSDGG